jgi:hypothetical protein
LREGDGLAFLDELTGTPGPEPVSHRGGDSGSPSTASAHARHVS